MNTIEMNNIEVETKTLSETKLELIEWILAVNNIDILQILLETKKRS